MKKKQPDKLAVFQAKSGAIELRADTQRETIWATQAEIAKVFGVTPQNITLHIKNIYTEGELVREATSKESLQVRSEGTRKVKRKVQEYNLDVMLSVGYRVNSKTATKFRQWATKTLRAHITKGFTINKKRLTKNYDNFLRAVTAVQKLSVDTNLTSKQDVLELVKAFASTWFSLGSFDKGTFPTKGMTKKRLAVESGELYEAVVVFKRELVKKGQATDLFAQEKRAKNLEGILGNVMQSVFGKPAYATLEEKAAHLLYFVVKNHPFNDGNKRTGAFAFVWFLRKAGLRNGHVITPAALTALTLLVAESKPKNKDQVIGLILLLLKT